VITKDCYVGSGGTPNPKNDLYSRICYYFRPCNLKTGTRKVEKYFNKNGFKNIELKLYIMNPKSNWMERLELEQYKINTLKPNLNSNLIAGGYYGPKNPMSEAKRIKLRKERGHTIYVYDLNSYLPTDQVSINFSPDFDFTPYLIFISDSKNYLIKNIKISAKKLNICLETNSVYLSRFIFSSTKLSVTQFLKIINKNSLITPKEEKLNVINTNLLSLNEFSELILASKSKLGLKRKQPSSKKSLD
jgi:hypothetical protein